MLEEPGKAAVGHDRMGSMGKAQVLVKGKEETELVGGEDKQVKRTDNLEIAVGF